MIGLWIQEDILNERYEFSYKNSVQNEIDLVSYFQARAEEKGNFGLKGSILWR